MNKDDMYYDNRVLDINGHSEQGLLCALTMAFLQNGKNTTCKSWEQSKEYGLILYWADRDRKDKRNSVIAPMSPEDCLPMVLKWLESEFAKDVNTRDQWDEDCKHDGSNSEGWRVYVEGWGHVNHEYDTICAIIPAYAWHGK